MNYKKKQNPKLVKRKEVIKIRAEINETETKTAEKINDKPLSRLTKIKREDPNKIRNERGEITTNVTKIQLITREYYSFMPTN